jgi:Fe-S-cluster containining protein
MSPPLVYCSRRDCILLTCSKNRCHIRGLKPKTFSWFDFSKDCGMLVSDRVWDYQGQEKDYIEEED